MHNQYFNCGNLETLLTIQILSQILIQILKHHGQTVFSMDHIV